MMGRVLTNNTSLAYSIEPTLGVAGTVWHLIEPNNIPQYGPEIATVARAPISKDRQRKKGTITDLDSSVEIEADLTLGHMIDFIEGFIFASATGGPSYPAVSANDDGGGDFYEVNEPDDPAAFLTADNLVFARGFSTAANNGLNEVTGTVAPVAASGVLTLTGNVLNTETVTIGTKVYTFQTVLTDVDGNVLIGATASDSLDNLIAAITLGAGAGTLYAASTTLHPTVTAAAGAGDTMDATAKVAGPAGNAIVTTETIATTGSWGGATLSGGAFGRIIVAGATLADETLAATANATVETAGVRGDAGDLTIDASGNLVSAGGLDWTAFDITPGQVIHVGGDSSHRFFGNGGGENFGFARVTAVTATTLTLDKKASTFVTDDGTDDNNGGVALEVDILFGRFIRNVDVDDVDYLERTFQFEAAWDNLGAAGADEYEYAKGNFSSELTFEFPLTDKALATFGFIGLDTDPPTGTRKTGAAAPLVPAQTTAFNTTADLARLRITEVDETGLTTDFKTISLTLNNNVSPEKVLGTLGAKFMNNGIFEVDIETQVLFTDGAVLAAIRNNTTVTMDFSFQNTDGGFFVDIPSMTLGDGSKDLPVNETVLVNLTGIAFKDPTLGASLGVSLFPWLPSA